MEKFEQGGLSAFRDWSFQIHDQVIETLPKSLDSDKMSGVDQHQIASQLSFITDEMNQLERQTKEKFTRLSSLATDLLAQVKVTKIQRWDPGKYYISFPSSRF